MINDGKVLALIPARGGSKGIPGKNIVPLGDRPLIAWTIAAARQSKYIDRVIVSSDDDLIISTAQNHGCEAPYKRTTELSGDESASIDVVIDALNRLPGFDYVVLLQPTSPLRTAEDIDGCIETMLAAGSPCSVSVKSAEDHPYLVFRCNQGGQLVPYSEPPAGFSMRRQDFPQAWCLNGAVYVARSDWLRAQRTFLTPLTVGYPMPTDRSIDIDTPADLDRARTLVQHYF